MSNVPTIALEDTVMTKNVLVRSGWRINDWCWATGISRSAYYVLPPDIAPEVTHVGRSHIIRESPPDWLQRVAEAQRSNARKPALGGTK